MTQKRANFRTLNPVTANTRQIAEVVNRTIDGGLNSVGYFTIPANTTQTTVYDPRYSPESLVFFTGDHHSPWHHNPYVDISSTKGVMVINHDNQGHDGEMAYLIIG